MEDLRSTTVTDDPVQRRDLILIERARGGDLDAFNDLVACYQDHLYALVVRMVPDRDQAADAVQEAFFSAYRNMQSFRGGSVRSWLSRICVNAAMDAQRARKRRPAQPYPELEDESWQP
ncbi:MAG TPA: sigma-70 family RNA polymerase sigma factor, partial [Candidatus Limnocylindrales bacterium]|nr:sigma-70 family RNA polymerase sigma factor [Candidatus Limnocylindrales bacterium]